MSLLTCPHCGTEQETYWENTGPVEIYEHECIGCEIVFGFKAELVMTYTERKLPCANGGSHNWEKMHGHPAKYYENWYMCSYCGSQEKKEV